MRYINKRNKKFRIKAHRIVNRFLRQGWSVDVNRYVNCDFSNFKRLRAFISLLFSEQNGLCCYCMRSLNIHAKGLYTLEHVMPQNVKVNDVAFYYAHVSYFRKLVRILKIDASTPRLGKFSPYPHFCAYENLVLSCSGAIYKTDNPESEPLSRLHECCNNSRGNNRVIPMFFDSKSSFDYNDDGMMDFPEKYEDSIELLRLESNINLKLIRKTWSELMWLYNIEDVKRAIDDCSLRKEMLSDTVLMPHEAKRMANDIYWELLYEYRWFGEHFLFLHSKKKKSKYRS